MAGNEMAKACFEDLADFCKHKVKWCSPAELTSAARIYPEAYAHKLLEELFGGDIEAAIHSGATIEIRAFNSTDGRPHTFNFGDYKPGGSK